MKTSQEIFQKIASDRNMNIHHVRAICTQPFLFARRVMSNIADSKDIRFAYLGTFKLKKLYADCKHLSYKEAIKRKQMNPLKVKIKKLREGAILPTYANPGDAGMDLYAMDISVDGDIVTYSSGIAVEIPEGYVGLMFSRSSIFRLPLIQSNCVGVIDSGYRGELMCKFRILPSETPVQYAIGDRYAQLVIVPYPTVEFEEVDELSDSPRGEGGYGSSNTPDEFVTTNLNIPGAMLSPSGSGESIYPRRKFDMNIVSKPQMIGLDNEGEYVYDLNSDTKNVA